MVFGFMKMLARLEAMKVIPVVIVVQPGLNQRKKKYQQQKKDSCSFQFLHGLNICIPSLFRLSYNILVT